MLGRRSGGVHKVTYKATVINVMTASPADIPEEEHRIVRDVIDEWNAIHAEERRLVLMPKDWKSHSSPEMGERPQEVINKQILRNCDLLIAVFWTKLGSLTGKALGGTVEEIEEHLQAEKPAMIYFSSTPVPPERIDSEQYNALKEFKESCRKRGLVEEYDSPAKFREKLGRQLAQTIIRNFTDAASPSGVSSVPEPESDPKLSPEAQELLLEAVKDKGRCIMKNRTHDGTCIQTNGREFSNRGDPRSEAKWEGAVDELYHKGLIEDHAGKGEVFFVTDKGYRAADYLQP